MIVPTATIEVHQRLIGAPAKARCRACRWEGTAHAFGGAQSVRQARYDAELHDRLCHDQLRPPHHTADELRAIREHNRTAA